MSLRHSSLFKAAWLLAVTVLLPVEQASAYDPQGKPRDNSGRQIAQVIPGMPHPGASPASASKVGVSVDEAAITPALPPVESITRGIDHAGRAMGRRLSSVSTPIQLSPEAKDALEKGAVAAQGLSNVALKRLSDCGTWVAVLLRNFNELPTVTPASVPSPEVETSQMKPIEDPGKGINIIYTSEHRFRTVTGR